MENDDGESNGGSKGVKFHDCNLRLKNMLLSTSGIAIAPGVVRVRDNLHLEQACTEFVPLRTVDSFCRVLSDTFPRLPYRRRRGEMKSLVHWGQRKLLMSEIEFLTNHSGSGATCVYAGAAPGNHINYLSSLFPRVHFICFDPKEFGCWEQSGHVTLRQDVMSDDIAEEFGNRSTSTSDGINKLLFISDIRSADWKVMTDSALEDEIHTDMTMQRRWHERMRPAASLLKFRLPWHAGTTEYLAGQIYLPVWAPLTSTEGRLVVTASDGICSWDHQQYWEQMFYFNTVTRSSAYDHPMRLQFKQWCGEGEWTKRDSCYDCAAEVRILSAYLRCRQLAGEETPTSSGSDTQKLLAGVTEAYQKGDSTPSAPDADTGLCKAVLQIMKEIDDACCSGSPTRFCEDKGSELPLSFSSGGKSKGSGHKKRKIQKDSTFNNKTHLRGRGAAALHITTKCTADILEDCLECRCRENPCSDLRSAEQSCQQWSACPSALSCSSWLLCMRDPDMTDLPHTDTGAWSPLGVGCEVPDGCALSLWLWGVLLQVDSTADVNVSLRHSTLGTTRTPLYELPINNKAAVLQACLESPSMLQLLETLSVFRIPLLHSVVILFGRSGYVYFYFMDHDYGSDPMPSLARLNINSGIKDNDMGICSGVIVRRRDGLLSIVLSDIISWKDVQIQSSVTDIKTISDKSGDCMICRTIVDKLALSMPCRLMMWRSVGIECVQCSHCSNSLEHEFFTDKRLS